MSNSEYRIANIEVRRALNAKGFSFDIRYSIFDIRYFFFAVFSLCLSSASRAADWPQWRGPDRNDISRETGLLKKWPKDGPPLLWTYKNAGNGYSGPAVVGDRL